MDDYQVFRKYNIKQGSIFEISEVNTIQRPFLYKLKDVHTDKEALGWYYGRELARADLSTDLEVERVLKEKTLKMEKHLFIARPKAAMSHSIIGCRRKSNEYEYFYLGSYQEWSG